MSVEETLMATLDEARKSLDEARLHAAKDDKAMQAALAAMARLERVARALVRRDAAQRAPGRDG